MFGSRGRGGISLILSVICFSFALHCLLTLLSGLILIQNLKLLASKLRHHIHSILDPSYNLVLPPGNGQEEEVWTYSYPKDSPVAKTIQDARKWARCPGKTEKGHKAHEANEGDERQRRRGIRGWFAHIQITHEETKTQSKP